jgi:hypothetical protein
MKIHPGYFGLIGSSFMAALFLTARLSFSPVIPAVSPGDRPIFELYGESRVHEYLDACSLSGTVPELVWVFWFGSKPMSENRARAFNSMKELLEIPIIVITEENIASLLKWPVASGIEYLSGIHKCDYFRKNFMYHYGGYGANLLLYSAHRAYSDIKHQKESWRMYFKEFMDPDVWMVGVPEIPGGVAGYPGFQYPENAHEHMISNGFMIAGANNPFLAEVHRMQNEDMKSRLEQLQAHPAPHSGRCCQGEDAQGYPIRWAELLGELMSSIAYKYKVYTHFKRVMQMPHFGN